MRGAGSMALRRPDGHCASLNHKGQLCSRRTPKPRGRTEWVHSSSVQPSRELSYQVVKCACSFGGIGCADDRSADDDDGGAGVQDLQDVVQAY